MAHHAATIPHTESFEYAKVVKFTYKWPVFYKVLYSELYPTGQSLSSPIFSTACGNDLIWQIKIYPNGSEESNKGNVSLYACLLPSKKTAEIVAKFQLSIIDEHGVKLNVREMSKTHIFEVGSNYAMSGFDKFIDRTYLKKPEEISETSTLTIVCEMKEVLEISNTAAHQSAVPFPMLEYQFRDNLRALYQTKKLSDVTLTVSGKTFQAHKVILAMHSPVFSAMFEHRTAGRVRNDFVISDVTPETFNTMLRFMYTGEVTGIDTMAHSLLGAAAKYGIAKLKTMCEEALAKNLDVRNAAEMLILADTHRADQLKPKALRYIASRTRRVMATAPFQSMVRSHPHLVAEALQTLATSVGWYAAQ